MCTVNGYDYYIEKTRSIKESKTLCVQDVTAILHSMAPIIRDVVSERRVANGSPPLDSEATEKGEWCG